MKLVLKFLLFFFAIFLSLFIFEVLLRLFTSEPENLAKLKSSSVYLQENKPNAEFLYRGSEFWVPIKINSLGFRDDEFKVQKDPDVFRIAVLGDSQEEALQVDLADTWQKVMAKKLSEYLSNVEGPFRKEDSEILFRRVETYNFGVSGYGTDQQWLILKEKVWQFAPDMVILAFSPNDVGDVYKNKLVRISKNEIKVVGADERAGGNALGRRVRRTYTYHIVVKASGRNVFLKRVVNKVRTRILGFGTEEKFFLSDAQLVQGPFEVVASKKNPPSEVLEGWRLVEALISDMKRQADERGIKFLITVNIPASQVLESEWDLIVGKHGLDKQNDLPYQINNVLAQIVQKEDIILFDPRTDAIEWEKENGHLHFERDRHFNKNGNLFMGTKVAEFIKGQNLIY